MTTVLKLNAEAPDSFNNPESDFSFVLADFICHLNPQTLSPEVKRAARNNILDTLTCAVAGSSAQGVAEVRELVTL